MDFNLNIAIGSFMKSARRSTGMTEEQLAKKMNLSQQQISRYENGRYNFTIETILLLLKALDKSFLDLATVVYWGDFEDIMDIKNKLPSIELEDDIFNMPRARRKKQNNSKNKSYLILERY